MIECQRNKQGVRIPQEPEEPEELQDEPDCYHTQHNCRYRSPARRGYATIEVLEFLRGRPFDPAALDYIHTVRPSCIRVTRGYVTSDSILWRVTVCLDDQELISSVRQEVEVGRRTRRRY